MFALMRKAYFKKLLNPENNKLSIFLGNFIRAISKHIDKLGHLEPWRGYKDLNGFEKFTTLSVVISVSSMLLFYFLSVKALAGISMFYFVFTCSLFVIYKFVYLLFNSNTKHYEEKHEISKTRGIFIELANSLWLGVFTFFLSIIYYVIIKVTEYKDSAFHHFISEYKYEILIGIVVLRFLVGVIRRRNAN